MFGCFLLRCWCMFILDLAHFLKSLRQIFREIFFFSKNAVGLNNYLPTHLNWNQYTKNTDKSMHCSHTSIHCSIRFSFNFFLIIFGVLRKWIALDSLQKKNINKVAPVIYIRFLLSWFRQWKTAAVTSTRFFLNSNAIHQCLLNNLVDKLKRSGKSAKLRNQQNGFVLTVQSPTCANVVGKKKYKRLPNNNRVNVAVIFWPISLINSFAVRPLETTCSSMHRTIYEYKFLKVYNFFLQFNRCLNELIEKFKQHKFSPPIKLMKKMCVSRDWIGFSLGKRN